MSKHTIDKFNKALQSDLTLRKDSATKKKSGFSLGDTQISDALCGKNCSNEIHVFINSEEFKALSVEDKKELLKKTFPQLENSQISSIIAQQTQGEEPEYNEIHFQFGSGLMSSIDTFDQQEILNGLDAASKDLEKNSEWENKSPIKKLNARLDAYLVTVHAGY